MSDQLVPFRPHRAELKAADTRVYEASTRHNHRKVYITQDHGPPVRDHPDPALLVDCRYLGPGGAGRVTELLLRGMASARPPGPCILWGPDDVSNFAWAGATWIRAARSPTRAGGQGDLFRVPRHDAAIYLHQIRPFHPGRAITMVYDTIPLRHGGSMRTRLAKLLYLKTIARLSTRIGTLSQYSASCIASDLRVPQDKITVLDYPVDDRLKSRVAALRHENPSQDVVLFVGRFAPHKNLPRLIKAFSMTAAAADGARLLLVGGTPDEITRLSRFIEPGRGNVELRPPCLQSELELLYATSRLLVMPSLEEGYGLPAWEAATCGLRVCLSDIPVFREIFPNVPRFDPRVTADMAAAIDGVLAASAPTVVDGSTIQDFADRLIAHATALL